MFVIKRTRQAIGIAATAILCGVVLSFTTAEDDAQASIVAGGMATVHRTFPSAPDGYADIRTAVTITAEPGDSGNTYWAHQWGYARGGEGGYAGLQQRSGTDKYLNFSIWGASGWHSTAAGASCQFFGHEGDGVQCAMPYAWVTGVTYAVSIERPDAMSWRAVITDSRSGVTTAVATIVLPDDRGGISWLSEWVENFSQGDEALPSCAAVPRATAVFGRPTANGGTVASTSSLAYTYGNCAAVARTVCASDQTCTLAVNEESNVSRSQLRNSYSGYCLDLLGGGTVAGLWECASNPNQLVTHDPSLRLAFSDRPGSCLTVGDDDRVGSAGCDETSRQQWLPIPRTSAYWNAGTGTCLEPVQNAQPSTPLRVHACLDNGYQQWTAIR